MRKPVSILTTVIVLFLIGCEAPKIRIFPSRSEPLQEYTLQGKAKDKVLVIPVRGIISDAPQRKIFSTQPSMVEEIVSQLHKAEDDPDVKAVLLKIDSPGGSVIASDLIYNEIATFKQRKKAKIVAAMMGVAASGGYYIALPADFIMAHPATVTGSVGVLFLSPNVSGLMEKIGIDVNVSKSGQNKDMGSPFRPATEEEKKIIQNITDRLGAQFLDHIAENRKLGPDKLKEIASARIYLAGDALKLGMIDGIGYLDEAVGQAKKLADLPDDAKVVVYRRTEYPDDNLYNTSTSRYEGRDPSIISLELPPYLSELQTGFYYLWQPGGWKE
jgi:protease-4